MPLAGLARWTTITRSPSGYGNPFMSAPYTMLNIVVVRPIPSVNARVATIERPGLLTSERMPYRTSRSNDCMAFSWPGEGGVLAVVRQAHEAGFIRCPTQNDTRGL